MAQKFINGETKVRPGVFYRYTSNQDRTAGAEDGIAAIVMNATWGPQETVTVHDKKSSIEKAYGSEVAAMLFDAGVTRVYAYRLKGSGGAKATATLSTGVTLTAKYEGLGVALKAKTQGKLGDSTKKQLLILDGTKLLEVFEFDVSQTDEAQNLVEAVANSEYITASKTSAGVIANQEVTFSGGVNPTVTAAGYEAGFEALEQYRYNVLLTDSVDNAVALLLAAYSNTAEDDGKQFIGVCGAPTSVAFADRKSYAAALNNKNVVYFGGGWTLADGTTIDGAKAVAYTAGIIAATPSSESIVHATIAGATDTTEKLTNAQYVEAIQNGLLLTSIGPNGQVWYDAGVTTLVTPTATEDDGWKKIKRVKVRKELFDRVDRMVSPLVGNVNCNPDGIAAVIQAGMGVIADMVSEGKILEGAEMIVDPEHQYGADSAWFLITATDVDSLEKIYLHFNFNYTQD